MWTSEKTRLFSREFFNFNSKNKKIRDRVDSRVQFVWRLRVMGSWYMGFRATLNFGIFDGGYKTVDLMTSCQIITNKCISASRGN